MDTSLKRDLIETVALRIIAHADELSALDRAIGDGDHGLNMKRGSEAVLADLDGLAAKPLPAALQGIGMTLLTKVGGAAGPIYGTLFMALGKALPDDPAPGDLAPALAEAIVAVKARGKSDVGQKTMLDVLVPVQVALAEGRDPVAAAMAGAEATVDMKAVRGRSSFLGERSVGHMDPGARCATLMIVAIAEVLRGQA